MIVTLQWRSHNGASRSYNLQSHSIKQYEDHSGLTIDAGGATQADKARAGAGEVQPHFVFAAEPLSAQT
jgi:hypothetical protein